MFKIEIPNNNKISMANDGTIDWIILVDIKPIPMQMSATFMALLMGRIDNFVKLPWIKNAASPIKKNKVLFLLSLNPNLFSVYTEKLVSNPEKMIMLTRYVNNM